MSGYVHGYSSREAERLRDQANTLVELLHHDTVYPPGNQVLEAGCGVGAQTVTLAGNSPGAEIVSVDISPDSLAQAEKAVRRAGLNNVRFLEADLFHLPFKDGQFDHGFICFVLEHLADPVGALRAILRKVKPGGTLTVIEGDHGSCYFCPETEAARRAWQCLIDVQAALGGDSLIGRRLYPLRHAAGLEDIRVSPRMVYSDATRPHEMEGFVRRTIIPMVEGVERQAQEKHMIDPGTWNQGIQDLHATGTPPGGTFCYTFFKAVAQVPGK
jgi:SAM-dependent methyltransferase